MKVLVAGASGLIGSALVPSLDGQGHETVSLSRSAGPGRLVWNPQEKDLDPTFLAGIDAVVNLAGSNLAEGRWTERRRKVIRDSRLKSTRLLVDAFHRTALPPRVFVCSSAIGYYGDTGEKTVAEDGESGSGFLAGLCRDWEAEAARANGVGVRVVQMRTGVVLSPHGGALAKLLPIFRAGLGGPVGGGKQWMSWISLDDIVGAISFVMAGQGDSVSGPVNAVSPTPVTNGEFAHVLGHVLGRPTLAPVPAGVLKLLYGAMAEETILASTRVAPGRLMEAGFQFHHPDLKSALRHVLKN